MLGVRGVLRRRCREDAPVRKVLPDLQQQPPRGPRALERLRHEHSLDGLVSDSKGDRIPVDAEDVAAYIARYAGVPGAKPPIAPGEGPGAQVYANQGCGSCHIFSAAQSAGVLGPNLDEYIPRMSRAQIKQAIVNPNATKAKGYENAVMPNRWSNLPPKELDQLVDFLVDYATGPGGN